MRPSISSDTVCNAYKLLPIACVLRSGDAPGTGAVEFLRVRAISICLPPKEIFGLPTPLMLGVIMGATGTSPVLEVAKDATEASSVLQLELVSDSANELSASPSSDEEGESLDSSRRRVDGLAVRDRAVDEDEPDLPPTDFQLGSPRTIWSQCDDLAVGGLLHASRVTCRAACSAPVGSSTREKWPTTL